MQQGLEEPQEYLTQVSTPKTAYCAAAVRAWQGICHSSETGTCGCTSLKQTWAQNSAETAVFCFGVLHPYSPISLHPYILFHSSTGKFNVVSKLWKATAATQHLPYELQCCNALMQQHSPGKKQPFRLWDMFFTIFSTGLGDFFTSLLKKE